MTNLSNAEKRAIWMECWDWVESMSEWEYDDGQQEALRRYPDPKEPTIVTTEHGEQWRVAEGKVQTREKADQKWYTMQTLTVSDLLALYELAQESLTNTQEKK